DTFPNAISSNGEIVGYFTDTNGNHAFSRSKTGVITSFDIPGSNGTFPGSVNTLGQMAGSYDPATGTKAGEQAFCFVFQPVSSFVRQKNGTLTLFNAFDSVVSGALGINRTGNFVGEYLDINCASHGYAGTL